MHGKPVAWVNVSSSPTGDAHASLAKILGYLNADIIPAPSSKPKVPKPYAIVSHTHTIIAIGR